MKLQKRLAMLLATTLLMTQVPVNLRAASNNMLNKMISMVAGMQVTTAHALFLEIAYKDEGLEGKDGDRFYISAQDFLFDEAAYKGEWYGQDTNAVITYLSSRELRIDTKDVNKRVSIPILGVAQKGIPAIIVDGADSYVTSGKYALTAEEIDGKVMSVGVAGDPLRLSDGGYGQIANIAIEEKIGNVLRGKRIKVTLPEETGLKFHKKYTTGNDVEVQGKRGLMGVPSYVAAQYGTDAAGKLKENELILSFSDEFVGMNGTRGIVDIKGIEVEPAQADKPLRGGNIHAIVSADTYIEPARLIVATMPINYSHNANLTSVTLDKGELTPVFDKDVTVYAATVPYEVEGITVDAKAEDVAAIVMGEGTYVLQEGINTIELTCIAESGLRKVYTLEVTREANPQPEPPVEEKPEPPVEEKPEPPVEEKPEPPVEEKPEPPVEEKPEPPVEEKPEPPVEEKPEPPVEEKPEPPVEEKPEPPVEEKPEPPVEEKPSTSGGGGGGSKPSTQPVEENVVQAIQSMKKEDKEQVVNKLKEEMPYTSLHTSITIEQLRTLTLGKFTDKQLEEFVAHPEKLEELGIDLEQLHTSITLVPVEDVQFKDVQEMHWANEAIKQAAQLGFVLGTSEGTFEPKATLGVNDAFTFLDRVLLLNGQTDMKLSRSTVEKYITNKGHWAFASVASIASKLNETTLEDIAALGDAPLTRELLAQVIYEITNGMLEVVQESTAFKDVAGSSYKEALEYCVKAGLFNGTSDITLSPGKTLTRAELVTILVRLNTILAQ